MKRSDIKIKVKRLIAFAKKWAADNLKDLNDKVYVQKSMSEYEANEQVMMALEFQELCEELERKGMEWKELREIVKGLPDRVVGEQKRLF